MDRLGASNLNSHFCVVDCRQLQRPAQSAQKAVSALEQSIQIASNQQRMRVGLRDQLVRAQK